jgi:hypothetical protein
MAPDCFGLPAVCLATDRFKPLHNIMWQTDNSALMMPKMPYSAGPSVRPRMMWTTNPERIQIAPDMENKMKPRPNGKPYYMLWR